jgi:N-glycosylase/DNA lyase
MKTATEPQLRELGFGYRANFIAESIKMIEAKGGQTWLEGLRGKPLTEVREQLVTLKGVGNKVADCIALFSLDCSDCVPVDTHVFQIAVNRGYVKGVTKQASLTEKVYLQ